MTDRPPIEVFRLDIANDAPVRAALRGGAVAIGNFDGVHRGHQALIRTAAGTGAPPIAATFEPHPRAVLQPGASHFRLNQPATRNRLLSIAGAEGIVEIAFHREMAALSAEAFAKTILADRLGARHRGQAAARLAGHTELLAALGREFGFEVRVLPPVTDETGEIISSGRARDALRHGMIDLANAVLGYRWFVEGTVVAGDRRGRELGYPTANIALPDPIELRHGIYAVTARWEGGTPLPAIASYGVRPVFEGSEPLLEVHLFDREDDLYGRELTITFLAWLRPEENFESVDALIRQMDADSAAARAIHAETSTDSRIDVALGNGA